MAQLILVLLSPAFEEAIWSGSALFVIQYINFYQQPE